MKKFLSTALALGMVAGLAATASALELKVTGRYVVDGYYIDQGNGAADKPNMGVWPIEDEWAEADSFYEHTFITNPDLIINDKIMMKSEIRFIDRATVWGGHQETAFGGSTSPGHVEDGQDFSVEKAWLVYDSPIGKWEVGRRPAGAWNGAFVNSSNHADRIMWWFPAMDNFKSYTFLEKQIEQDGYNWDQENNDKDYYEVAGGYEAEGVKAWLGLGWMQDQRFDMPELGDSETDMYRFKGYGEFAINETFSMATEWDYKWGEITSPGSDIDTEGVAFILSGMGKFGALGASLHYAFISGDDPGDSDRDAYDATNGMGWDFEPLYIMTGNVTNIANGYRGPNLVGTSVRESGVHAVVALADYAASEDLTLHAGLGWAQADEAHIVLAPGINLEADDEYGWEVDLGLAYKLYANLTYELHFGWWAVGDFAEANGLLETEDVLLLSHHLSMKF